MKKKAAAISAMISALSSAYADGVTPATTTAAGTCYASGSSGPVVPCIRRDQTTWDQVLRPTDPIDGATVGGSAISTILGSKAPLASPTFSDSVTAPSLSLTGTGIVGPADGGTVGGRAFSSFISGAGGKTTLTPDALTVTLSQSGAPACASTQGAFATDGSKSWQPGCLGSFFAPGQNVIVYPTRGTDKDDQGNPTSNLTTPSLIQAIGDGSQAVQPNGQVINFDVVGGSYSDTGAGNAVGQSVFASMRPDSAGNKPAPTWAANYDIVMAAGSGNTQAYGLEIDVNNNNADCAPGSGRCQAVNLWFNGTSGYSTTAFMYGGGYGTYEFTGTVTTTPTTVIWSSGPQFNDSIRAVTIGGMRYRVNYVSATQLSAVDTLPTNASAVGYTARVQATHNGIFFNDFDLVSDNDAWFNTAAYTGLKISGQHFIGFDTSSDARMRYALTAGPGQQLCLNNQDACQVYVGNNSVQWQIQGRNALQVTGGVSASADFALLQTGAQGTGPTLSVGTAATAPVILNLAGANNGGVKAIGPLYTTASIFINNTGDTGIGAVNSGIYLDGSNIVVRGVTAGGNVLIQDRGGASTYASFNASAGATFNSNLNITGTYYIGSVAGVSCTGVPTSNYQVTKGIVTRC